MELKIATNLAEKMCCPCCQSNLERINDSFKCTHSACGAEFPIVAGAAVLINESDSLFSVSEIVQQAKPNTESPGPAQRISLKRKLRMLVPRMGVNLKAKKIYIKFSEILHQQTERPVVLILGCGGQKGEGLSAIQADRTFSFVETDITLHGHNCLACDAHDIPFADETFDGIIVQAVLEHVINPSRCVDEIWRVLKKDGVIYADTPFMQQVHEGRYDFTRFTHLGHRYLFRKFEEIDSGAVLGPGCALAWAYSNFLLSFVRSPLARNLVKIFSRFTSFWWKYFDYFLIDKPGALDAASAYFFLGRKADHIISGREIVKQYRGSQQ